MGFSTRTPREDRRRPRPRGDPYSHRWRVKPPAVSAHHVEDDAAKPRGGGLGYAHYLIPRENDARPTLERVARLVSAWLDAGYVARSGSPAQQRMSYQASHWAEAGAATGAVLLRNRIVFSPLSVPLDAAAVAPIGDGDYRVLCPIDTAWTAGLKVPLTASPTARRGDRGPAYNLEIHSLRDYVYLTSDIIGPFATDDPINQTVPCRVSQTNLRYSAERIDNMFDQMGARIRHVCPTCSTRFRPQERTAQARDGWSGDPQPVAGGATYRFAIQIDSGTAVPESSPRAVPEFKQISEAALGLKLYEIGNAY